MLSRVLNRFGENDKIKWGLLCSKEIRNLKKLVKEITIDGKECNTYKSFKKVKDWVDVKIIEEDLSRDWKDKVFLESGRLRQTYYKYKDLCELLKECLDIHEIIKKIRVTLKRYKNIPEPQWNLESLRKDLEIVQGIDAKRTTQKIKKDLEIRIFSLEPYKQQKNKVADLMISAYEKRSLDEFRQSIRNVHHLIKHKREFEKLYLIKQKIDSVSDYLFNHLRVDIDNDNWNHRFSEFERAWFWKKADSWIHENNTERSYKKDQKGNINSNSIKSEKIWNCWLQQKPGGIACLI